MTTEELYVCLCIAMASSFIVAYNYRFKFWSFIPFVSMFREGFKGFIHTLVFSIVWVLTYMILLN